MHDPVLLRRQQAFGDLPIRDKALDIQGWISWAGSATNGAGGGLSDANEC